MKCRECEYFPIGLFEEPCASCHSRSNWKQCDVRITKADRIRAMSDEELAYAELVTALRTGYCDHKLLNEAADAIEELMMTAQSYKRGMEAWADEASLLASREHPGRNVHRKRDNEDGR